MFSNLDMDSDSDNIQCSRENEIRKAKKKLKAIEKLNQFYTVLFLMLFIFF